jgi:hypothetical protein
MFPQVMSYQKRASMSLQIYKKEDILIRILLYNSMIGIFNYPRVLNLRFERHLTHAARFDFKLEDRSNLLLIGK